MEEECETVGGGGLLGGSGRCTEPFVETGLLNDEDDTGTVELVGGGGCDHTGQGPGLGLALLVVWTLRALFALLLVPAAHAQDLQLLQVLEGGPFVTVHPADPGPSWSGTVTLAAHTALTPVAVTRTGASRYAWMRTLQTTELAATFAVGRHLGVGTALPVHRAVWNGVPDPDVPTSGPGDATVWSTLSIPGSRHPLALRVQLERSRRRSPQLLAHNAFSFGFVSTRPFLKGTLGWHLLLRMQSRSVLPGVTVGNRMDWAVGYEAGIGEEDAVVHGAVELFGSAPVGLPRGLVDIPMEATGSLRVRVFGQLHVQSGVAVGLTRGLGAPSARLFGSLQLAGHPPRDTDGDGVRDLLDRCRIEPEDHDGFHDGDGCPDPDNDRDGLLDVEDTCPDHAEVFNDLDDEDGCPDAMARWTVRVTGVEVAAVTIGDEVVRLLGGESFTDDFAPGTQTATVTAAGCETVELSEILVGGRHTTTTVRLAPLRTGTLAIEVHDPEGRAVPGVEVELDGEAWELVATALADAVEMVVGRHSVVASAPGYLPESARFQVRENEDLVVELVLYPTGVRRDGRRIIVDSAPLFELDSARLQPAALEGLDALADWMQDNPEVELLRVEGHADSIGGSRYNLELSERRASSVRDALIERGVQPDRLVAIGSGEALVWRGPERVVGFTILVDARL